MKRLRKVLMIGIIFIFVSMFIKAKICKGGGFTLVHPSGSGGGSGNILEPTWPPKESPSDIYFAVPQRAGPQREEKQTQVVQDPRVDELQSNVKEIKSTLEKLIDVIEKELGKDIDIDNEENKQSDKDGKIGNKGEITIKDIQKEVGNITETITELDKIIYNINKENIQNQLEKDLAKIEKEIEELNDKIEGSGNVFGTNSIIRNRNALEGFNNIGN